MLKHVALEVTETDIRNFYTEILGGEITRQFTLQKEVAWEIFQLAEQIKGYNLSIGLLELELFVRNNTAKSSLNHVCIVTENAFNIYQKALVKGYWTHLRKGNFSDTYFIKDHNGNMFELKNIETYHE